MKLLRKPINLLFVLVLSLTACQSYPKVEEPIPTTDYGGLIEIKVEGLGTSNLQSQALVHEAISSSALNGFQDNLLELELLTADTFTVGSRDNNGKRYVNMVYKVSSSDATVNLGDLVLIAAHKPDNISKTAISNMKLFDGSDAADNIALLITPVHNSTFIASATGQSEFPQSDNLSDSVHSADLNKSSLGHAEVKRYNLANFQAFEESEISNISLGADQFLFPYGFSLSPFGFNPADRKRELQQGEDTVVSISAVIPLQESADKDPFSFSWWFKAAKNDNKQFTQGLQEFVKDSQTSELVNEIASGSNPVTLKVLRFDEVVNPPVAGVTIKPICTLRISGNKDNPVFLFKFQISGDTCI